ncbi:MAG: type II toxin-antitoxin system HicB family antitoxin [Acetobacteraceae bacterium]|nr:type II toxin-antitoxin system HicB family antitoxin [Acetobacteraceae bacterium]
MALRFYPAVIDQAEDGGFGVAFPDLPGCTSAGSSAQDAALQAAEALRLHVAGLVEDGESLPDPSEIDAPVPDWLAEVVPVARVLVPVEVLARPSRVIRLNITLPEELVRSIDRVSGNRSRFLADAARAALG